MDLSSIIALIAAPLDLVKSIGLAIIELIGRGHPDETKLAELKYQYELAVKNLDINIKQAELWLAEKLMVNAKWQYPLVMISGCSIISICLFNIVIKSLNIGVAIDIFTPEMVVLLGMFLFVTSGSSEIFNKIAIWIISKIPEKPNNIIEKPKKNDK